MKTLNKLTFLLVFAISAVVALAGPFNYDGLPGNDVDTNPATLLDLTVPDFGNITSLSLTFVLTGICGSDNEISLIHGATTALAASSDGGICSGSTDPSGTYPLAAFIGQDINGLWQLKIQDLSVFLNDGNDITSWSISGETDAAAAPEPASVALMGAGLLGLGIAAHRRRRK